MNFIEDEHAECIADSGRVAEAKLLKKYKGMRFFDEDDGGMYFRIRSDRLTWKGKRSGGWVVVCDKMPGDDPALDPVGDSEINADDDVVEYLINGALHDMITAARQAPGTLLVAKE